MRWRKATRRFLVAALMAAFGGMVCSSQRTASGGTLLRQQNSSAPAIGNPQTSAVPAAPAAAKKPAGRTVTDETGRRMEIPFKVERVVTLAPSLTETIYALGLEGKLAADTTYCDIPPAAKDKPHVGGPQSPSLEAIVAMHPDLVLASTSINQPVTADALLKLGIPVYTTSDEHTVREMLDSTAEIADLLGVKEQGAKIVADLQKRLDALHAALQERPMAHVLFVVWEEPLISIGQNTFIADALRWAGAESVITSGQNWPQVSMEEVVRLQPDYIVLSPDHMKAEGSAEADSLSTRPTWRDLQAVKLRHVVVASDEMDRPSPGLIAAIEQLAQDFHPEAFEKRENRNMKAGNGPYFAAAINFVTECNACGR
ncbi:MAG: ABC transporter substrate-binding protein [Candidatus Acidiferrales bacterium]